ncbi:MAG: 3-dehydroquinate synthase, partial [Patescibacteria group bacterium]|nr:3-dehydroquinate synthase [Patescibacteria group bacterium]
MKKVLVNIINQSQTYPIFIGSEILRKIESLIPVEKYGKIIVITDNVIEKVLFKNKPELFSKETHTIVLPFGERAKNIETVEEIWRELLELNCDRSSLIVNIGGGVISDVGGFAASTFMRGIDFINAPTTLLSQVDASVGGKTGVNFEDIKNIVGTIQQPKAVVIDVETLASLPTHIMKEGFGEIIKHGLIADKTYFEKVTAKKPETFTKEELIEIITRSCEIKADIVEQDINESGLRRLVNFGHTIGHALEAASHETNNPLLHGEAVSIGMIAESYISLEKRLISKNDFETIIERISYSGLPTKISGLNKDVVLEKMHHDKKQEKGEIQWTLIK